MHHSNRLSTRSVFASVILGIAALQTSGCSDAARNGLYGFEDQQFGYYRARRDGITAGIGDSVAHNIAAQTKDPWPTYSANKRIDVDGERALIAIKRYKANESIEPNGLATQTISP